VLIGLGEVLRLEVDDPQEGVGHPAWGLQFGELAGQLFAARPIALHQLHQERLLNEHIVAWIARQRFAIVCGGGLSVVLAARKAAGKVAAKQRAGRCILVRPIASARGRRHRPGPRQEGEDHRQGEQKDAGPRRPKVHRIASAHVTS
jgi:hypothetical protein